MPTRRNFLTTIAAAAPQSLHAQQPPPNILLVLSDDHSFPFLGAYGADYLSTPNLDRFARQGMLFDRAFTAAPQCVPSRTAILTGRSPVSCRMGRFNSPLPADVVTLPEVLRTRGYYTGVCGRYFHLDGLSKAWITEVTQSIYEKHGLQNWHRRVDFLESGDQAATPARLEEFLARVPKGRPWFMWMNYIDPHHAWDSNAGKVSPASIKLPPHLPDLPGVRGDLARHLGEVERLDGIFEQSLAVLRKHGLEQTTLVVFMGDNGMAFPHGKGSLYDSGLNVPLAIRWPGRIKPGRSQALISGEDITPTLLEAAGAKPLPEMTGRSFLPLLTGGAHQPRQYIFAARLHHGNAPFTERSRASNFDLSRCVRSERWKLIYNCTPQMEYQPVDSAGQPSWKQMVEAHLAGKLDPKFDRAYFGKRPVLELYDLNRDPGELDNLAGRSETVEIQQQLMRALSEKMITDFDFLPPPLM